MALGNTNGLALNCRGHTQAVIALGDTGHIWLALPTWGKSPRTEVSRAPDFLIQLLVGQEGQSSVQSSWHPPCICLAPWCHCPWHPQGHLSHA